MRVALATGKVRAAGAFPIEIIADMYDQVRVPGGNGLGNLGERPGVGIVTCLIFLFSAVDAPTGVSDHRDALDRTLRKQQVLVEYRCCPDAERDGRLTGGDRKGIRHRRAARHGDIEVVDQQRWAFPVDDYAGDESPFRAELEPYGG